MTKWHISIHGIAVECEAEVRQCTRGGLENHYDSYEEAQEAADQQLRDEYGETATITQEDSSSRLTSNEFAIIAEANHRNMVAFKTADRAFDAAHQRYMEQNNGKPSFREFPVTDEMFDAHQERKRAMYAYAVTDAIHKEHAEAHGIDRNDMAFTSYTHYEEKQRSFDEWKEQSNHATGGVYVPNHNPTMNGKEGEADYSKAINMLSAFTGEKPWNLRKDVEMIQAEQGIDRHRAVQYLYANAKQRTDKPFVYIDLETAARKPDDIGVVDDGAYSEIIEVGYIKVYPDGRAEERSFLLDADENLKKVAGTGAEHIHNISVDMIEGKPKFSDPKVQEHMMKVLDKSVLVAHSANFENTQFSYNLRGYARERSKFNIEVLDTKVLSKCFVQTHEGNSNKALVETAGIEYNDQAHRALEDIRMTKSAVDEILQNREKYLHGSHQYNAKILQRQQEELKRTSERSLFDLL